ncbi:MAG: tripartite tricarboxylate transporter substrate binding protein [Polaromonas sp.]|uniref:Bug family tripartite tricarboxylate transporter substrate binding protein n=1 Tax=Polaromonas sp. TaxID=1869339 RepID=UPI0025D7579C|nr:tripartite tricarboxylate transporter substrate binding protein [Polaromonas sp.]MBI2728699.1 tripartite tricarboxylate transporter substrate binding protein [Polaromonas sp.]
MTTKLTTFLQTCVLTTACIFSAQAMAQAYPTRPVKLVVPYPAGGPVDGVARGAADRLSKIWGQPVVVENKAGANEVIAADFVAKSPADGYTILFGADPTFATNQFLFKKLPYDPVKDLVPVSRIAIVNMAIILSGTFPPNNMKEFVSLVKANPGKFNYSAGAGTAAHVQFDAFLRQQGLEMTHIAYKGTASALQDILSGQIQATMGGITVAKPHLASGKMKLLAINGNKRTKSLPDVPTYAEAGFPNTQAFFYVGFAVPKGTPKNVIDAITTANRKVANDAEFIEKSLDPYAYEPITETPEQFAKFLVGDRKLAEKRIREAGARLEQ